MGWKLKNFVCTASVALAILVFGSPLQASTPDGETPANEGVCDVLIGATPGLYGLCNAYCEAQDLDTFDKNPPRTKILDNYNKKKQAGDPDMPCIQVPCPCWSQDEIDSISVDGFAAACTRLNNTIRITDNAPKLHFAETDTSVDRERCRYINLNEAPPVIRFFQITQEEAQSCAAQVEAACATNGL